MGKVADAKSETKRDWKAGLKSKSFVLVLLFSCDRTPWIENVTKSSHTLLVDHSKYT